MRGLQPESGIPFPSPKVALEVLVWALLSRVPVAEFLASVFSTSAFLRRVPRLWWLEFWPVPSKHPIERSVRSMVLRRFQLRPPGLLSSLRASHSLKLSLCGVRGTALKRCCVNYSGAPWEATAFLRHGEQVRKLVTPFDKTGL